MNMDLFGNTENVEIVPTVQRQLERSVRPPISVFSFGGGVQSMAVLVLTAQGKLKYDAFLFCNVGKDSEHPKTLAYVREHAMPYAAKNGIELIELHRRMRDGKIETLMDRINRTQSSIPLPVRMSNGAPGNRTCTADFKIRVVAKYVKQLGATNEDQIAVGIGISIDEISRMNTNVHKDIQHVYKEHPLIDLNLSRNDCRAIIASAGLPIPPKSSCYFCPFHKMSEWQRMKREEPELFEKSIQLEELINRRREQLGKDKVWLTRFNRPLKEVVDISQDALGFIDDNCESGFCMT